MCGTTAGARCSLAPRAVVAGSGPNGLSAAIVLAQAGFAVEVREAAPIAGGATRSGELTLPGFLHDLGSAIHPMAVASPFFSSLPLSRFGLEWIWPSAQLAHPLDDGGAVLLEREVRATAAQLGEDGAAYQRVMAPLAACWEQFRHDVLKPVGWPRHPLSAARFGLAGCRSARGFANANFRGERARALFAGLAAHSFLPLESPFSAAIALVLAAAAHQGGWPLPRGGAQSIASALEACLAASGGKVVTGSRVRSLQDLQEEDLIFLDVTPRQLVALAGDALRAGFRRRLQAFRYGPGVYKMDWALSEPIPWLAPECRRAGTVHLGGTFEEIAQSERMACRGEFCSRPFVLLAQPTLFDPSRAPAGRHIAWAYCHVPNGWRGSAQQAIEDQIERFAPGFRECILMRAASGTAAMEAWNENLVGGDINGGSFAGMQLFFRPTWRLYDTSIRRVYLCSSSTPPGGGVHGMGGYWAAQRALRRFRMPGASG